MAGFNCQHCNTWIPVNQFMGTKHRNHCPACLWSVHLDRRRPGDRQALCQAAMEPIALTTKHEGLDKQGLPRLGELMLVHRCTLCGKININRLAGDDDPAAILAIFESGFGRSADQTELLKKQGISILTKADRSLVLSQLYGGISQIHKIDAGR